MKYLFWSLGITFLGVIFIQQLADRSPVFFEAFTEENEVTRVQVAGLAPQIELMQQIAAENGWEVTCEGASGELTVMHLKPGLWARLTRDENDPELDYWQGDLAFLSTGGGLSSVPPSVKGCDYNGEELLPDPGSYFEEEAADGDIPLVYGTREDLLPALDMIRSCGLAQPSIRDFSAAEREALMIDEVPDQAIVSFVVSPDDTTAEMLCAAAMVNHHLTRLDEEG